MTKFRIAVLLLMLQAGSSFAASAPPRIGAEVFRALESQERVPVIVLLRDPVEVGKAAVARATAIAAGQSAVLTRLPAPSFALTARWTQIPGFAGMADREAVALLEADPSVQKVDLDTGGTGGLAVSVPLIRGDVVRQMGYRGSGITVAVLDSGIDLTHPDLAGSLVDQACFCTKANGLGCCPNGGLSQTGPGAARDDNGHGTNVSGIIASRGRISSSGVAPDVSLVAVRVLDANNSFLTTSQVISGLNFVIDQHPEVRVVNMSLLTNALFPDYCDQSTSFTGAFAIAIDILHSRGAVVVVCTGNNGSTTQMGAPACVRNSLSVGAVYKANIGSSSVFACSDTTTAADQVTCFSNTNSTLDMLGPGAPITSDGVNGGLSTYYGTSQATPHVAGAAAILLSINPSLTADQVERILKSTGKPVTDPRTGMVTSRVDVLAAVNATPRPEHTSGRKRLARH